ncbi:MAG: hypothetical protein R3C56_38955 [Pirellulaceae bacterium]
MQVPGRWENCGFQEVALANRKVFLVQYLEKCETIARWETGEEMLRKSNKTHSEQ